MPRPVFHPELGKFFVELRKAKGWTQNQAEDIAARKRLSALTHQVLWRLEQGKIKNIDPAILRAVATLYQVSYDDLVAQWTRHRYGVSLAAETSVPQTNTDIDREAAAQRKKVSDVTSTDTHPVLHDGFPVQPGSGGSYAESASDREQEDEYHRLRAQLRVIERRTALADLIDHVLNASDDMRSLVTLLRSSARTPAAGGTEAEDGGGDVSSDTRPTRRGRRA